MVLEVFSSIRGSGEWEKNVAHGMGNYVHHAKGQVTRYFGQWHQDLQHGLGVGAFSDSIWVATG